MSELPRGWIDADLNTLTAEHAPIGYGVLQPGAPEQNGVRMIRVTDVRTNTLELEGVYLISASLDEQYRRSRVQANDVLVSVQGTVGRVAIVPPGIDGSNISRTIARIRPADPALSRWIWLALRSPQVQRLIQDQTGGTTRDSLNIGALREIRVPVAPLAEQRRIVAKLDQVMARTARARAELARIPALIAHHKRAILAAAFDGALVSFDAPLTMRPIRGVLKALDQGWSPKCESDAVLEGEAWAVMKTTAIQPIEFDGRANKRLPNVLIPRPELQIAAGDVLITRAGPRSRVGICCVVKTAPQKVMLCDKAYRLRSDTSLIEPAYLTWMLNSPQALDLIESMKTGISDSGLNLTQDKILELAVPVPLLDVQREVMRRIESAFAWLDKVAHEHAQATRLLDHLDQALLAKAFRGELVPQDPADEPAATLLARIRAERETAPPPARKRKAQA